MHFFNKNLIKYKYFNFFKEFKITFLCGLCNVVYKKRNKKFKILIRFKRQH